MSSLSARRSLALAMFGAVSVSLVAPLANASAAEAECTYYEYKTSTTGYCTDGDAVNIETLDAVVAKNEELELTGNPIRNLQLNGTDISDAELMKNLGKLTSLHTLNLNGASLDSIEPLLAANLPNLTTINSNNRAYLGPDNGVTSLEGIDEVYPNLIRANFDNNQIADASPLGGTAIVQNGGYNYRLTNQHVYLDDVVVNTWIANPVKDVLGNAVPLEASEGAVWDAESNRYMLTTVGGHTLYWDQARMGRGSAAGFSGWLYQNALAAPVPAPAPEVSPQAPVAAESSDDEDTAAVGGVIYLDINGSGAKDAVEPLVLSPVTVSLVSSSGSVRSLTTSDGSYSFSGVAPGTYTVDFGGVAAAVTVTVESGSFATADGRVS